nr:hypothetical protein [Paenibacillus dakarensis]
MDIVKSHIEKLNGLIDIQTAPGVGTEFRMRLPLTLAIIDGMIIKLSGQTFIIPMSSIAEIVRIKAVDLGRIQGKRILLLRLKCCWSVIRCL